LNESEVNGDAKKMQVFYFTKRITTQNSYIIDDDDNNIGDYEDDKVITEIAFK
jgi:hypothetical protein